MIFHFLLESESVIRQRKFYVISLIFFPRPDDPFDDRQ